MSTQATPATAFAVEPLANTSPSPILEGFPAQLTSFVGREREIAAVRQAFAATRLLSLTGAGGSGKTRLALEVVAREAAATGQSGAWVELAPVHDPSLVAVAVLATLGIRDESEFSPLERLTLVLGGRPFLLVLDNCEHLVEACAALADTLLRACPALRILATSREALGVTGETAWLVPPLSLPRSGDAAVDDSEAVQLFVQRATAVHPGFELSAENRDVIAQICRRLDGLPLALELAAARLRVLTPHQIASRLDDRFRLLKTGNRAALPRHQTLRAAIDWSYELLDERERLLLERLAVFGGSFTLEAAEAVCADGPIALEDVLDLVSELVEKSLVEMVESGDVARYRLLETVREYAGERLEERGEFEERRRSHAGYFFALAAEAEPHLATPRRPQWIARLETELDNLRQTLAWTREGDPELHMRLVGMLHWFWFATGQWPEARQWLRSALTVPNAERRTRDRAAVLFSAGSIATAQGRAESARVHLVEAESIAEEIGDARLLAYIRNYLGVALSQIGDPAAEVPAQLAFDWFREANDLYGLRLSFLLQGAVRLFRGDITGAVELAEEGVRVARVFGLGRELAIALQQLAMTVICQGDMRRATALVSESLDAIRRDPQLFFTARSLEMMASCVATQGAPLEAARLRGAAEAMRESIGARMWVIDREQHAPFIAAAEQAAGAEAFEAARAEGRALRPEDAIEFALQVASRIGRDDEPDPSTNTAEYEVVRPPTGAQVRAPSLRVLALGPLEIAVDGTPVSGKSWGYAKARELLVFLLSYPEGRTREQVGAALWPEASSAQVRNNFHVTLHHLRRALGRPEWVRFDRDRYCVAPLGEIALDAVTFEESVTRALRARRRGAVPVDELRDALALYRGDFLDGETAGDWHFELRDRLARLHASGLEALGEALLAENRCDEATSAFERLVQQEELHEAAYRSLMIARARAGDRTGAMREYRRLEAVLRRELEVEPQAETMEVFRRVQRGERV
ncbi:MAG TPA: BTAD domain-containing putative transcriptional regulator [Gemmatimonadaceae bacterium]|nr:BTAD domain-containing putative transcriptional regulator [Gemmatimonadaceae bacterium]